MQANYTHFLLVYVASRDWTRKGEEAGQLGQRKPVIVRTSRTTVPFSFSFLREKRRIAHSHYYSNILQVITLIKLLLRFKEKGSHSQIVSLEAKLSEYVRAMLDLKTKYTNSRVSAVSNARRR
jgi:hypothetical protein